MYFIMKEVYRYRFSKKLMIEPDMVLRLKYEVAYLVDNFCMLACVIYC